MDQTTNSLIDKLLEETYDVSLELINNSIVTKSLNGLRMKNILLISNEYYSLVWPRQNPKTFDMKLSRETSRLFSVSLMKGNNEVDWFYLHLQEFSESNYWNSLGINSNCYPIPYQDAQPYTRRITSDKFETYQSFYKDSGKGRPALVNKIDELARGNPRRLYRTIQNIRRVQDWCRDRIGGLKRLLDNNKKEQERYLALLEAEKLSHRLVHSVM